MKIKSQINVKNRSDNKYKYSQPIIYSTKYNNLQVLTSEGWGLFLLLPDALPVRIAPAFLTFFSLKSVWYVEKLLLPLLGKIFEVSGLCMY